MRVAWRGRMWHGAAPPGAQAFMSQFVFETHGWPQIGPVHLLLNCSALPLQQLRRAKDSLLIGDAAALASRVATYNDVADTYERPQLFSTMSTTWTPMDSSVKGYFTTPAGSSNYNALFTASADLYSSSSAWTNADMGICIAAATNINGTCTSGASIIGAQTSGSVSGGMPIASLVEATATLTPNTAPVM